MAKKRNGSPLDDLKDRLDRAGLSRRDALVTALGAAGAALVTFGATGARAEPTNCSPDSCAYACVNCRDGCSNGPTGK